jgi:peptidoglycan/xylan/chitin deacetylase (PgdA/CDA1 family)
VINRQGVAEPGTPHLLGEDIFLRSLSIADGWAWAVADIGNGDPYACCPSDARSLGLQVQDGALVLLEEYDLPDPALAGRAEWLAKRLDTQVGDPPLIIEDEVGFNQIDRYRVHAGADQVLAVDVVSPDADVLISVFGEDEGQLLASILDGTTSWVNSVPSSQDYLIQVVAASGDTPYTLTVQVKDTDQADLQDVQESNEKVIYLTFDDGPNPTWTPRILEVLARYSAKATFFMLGSEVERNPLTTAAVAEAGHALANHGYNHRSFESITRQGFRREVGSTQELFTGGGVLCLRPPYGTIDAYTRIYAAELGYRTYLWDVDPQDWRRPGVTTIVNNVLSTAQPGDIVLLHDGGGDRSQTVLALEIILSELTAQGYIFKALCE